MQGRKVKIPIKRNKIVVTVNLNRIEYRMGNCDNDVQTRGGVSDYFYECMTK